MECGGVVMVCTEINLDFVVVLLNSSLVLFMLGKLFCVAEEVAEIKEKLINLERIINHDNKSRENKGNKG